MDAVMITSSPFQKPPLIICKGSGLYQIHLVKAEAVRPFIPDELRTVETLGYTLGGFYFGTYEDSSFGPFDELVVFAGIVRKNASSRPAAWAARVLVSSLQVQDHSRKVFGVPSQVANFIKHKKTKSMSGGFLNINGLGNANLPRYYKDIQIREGKKDGATNSWNIGIKTAEATSGWDLSRFIISPLMKLSLVNLSGVTEFNPHLLEYICQIETRVRIVAPTKVSAQLTYPERKKSSKFQVTDHYMDSENMRNLAIRKILMQSKPLVAFEFNSMKMIVDSPAVISPRYNA